MKRIGERNSELPSSPDTSSPDTFAQPCLSIAKPEDDCACDTVQAPDSALPLVLLPVAVAGAALLRADPDKKS